MLGVNDNNPSDNSRGWHVKVEITPPAGGGDGTGTGGGGNGPGGSNQQPAELRTHAYGAIGVVNRAIRTGLDIRAGSSVHVQANGLIDFGGGVFGAGAPKLGPDGDNDATPADYPEPRLKKNSLILKIGTDWYQGGSNETFVPSRGGELVIQPNDRVLTDNSRGWSVRVTVSPPGAITDDPLVDRPITSQLGPGIGVTRPKTHTRS